MPALRLPGATYAVPVPLDSTDVPSRLISGDENSRRASISRSACRLLCEHLRVLKAGWHTWQCARPGQAPEHTLLRSSSICPKGTAEQPALTSQQQTTVHLAHTQNHKRPSPDLWRACARLRASCSPAPAHWRRPGESAATRPATMPQTASATHQPVGHAVCLSSHLKLQIGLRAGLTPSPRLAKSCAAGYHAP